ncbi:hypothetical protein RDI58_006441 [Solanum bulbocastanum]|uniref:Uncharacterized protein n=1 Tax=Solanum bulbocastanum TaxID=147425 RepID=A0AAN8U0Q9_SOLBU
MLLWMGSVSIGVEVELMGLLRVLLLMVKLTNLLIFGLVTQRLCVLATAPGHSTSPSTEHRPHHWVHQTTMWVLTVW